MIALNILSSLFLGSSLSLVITKFLLKKFPIDFYTSEFSRNVIGVTESLAKSKTFDIVEFLLFILLSLAVFGVNFLFSKKGRSKNKPLILGYAAVSFLIFLQSHFVYHSGKTILFQIIVLQIFFWLFTKKRVSFKNIDSIKAINGLILGFYLLILTKLWTTSFVIPFSLFLFAPLFYLSVNWPKKILKNPAYPVLILAAFFPFNKLALFSILAVFIFLNLFLKNFLQKNYQKKIFILYPYFALFIFVYNPYFYVGTLDSLEEGFWLAWAKRLLDGEILYKDFYAYHPPLISWGLSGFLKLTNASVYHARLYFHTLQIIGIFIIYTILDKLLDSRLLKILTLVLILSFLIRNLLNNVEIRLGTGLLTVSQLILYIKTNKKKYLLSSGAASAISFLVSTEVGIASFISTIISLFLISIYQKKKYLNFLKNYFLGTLFVFLPIFLALTIKGSIYDYFINMRYVLSLFASGYSNAAIGRTDFSNLLHWRNIDAFFSSTAFWWQFARMSMAASFMYIFYKAINKKIEKVDLYALMLTMFSVFLVRTALGRSDKYHLLTLIIPSTILFSYLVQEFISKARYVGVGIIIFLMFYSARQEVNAKFLHNQIVKFQTYGSVPGRYPNYKMDRMKILAYPGTDTQSEDKLVDYIKKNVGTDESIFVFPQKPEIYFLTDRKNATSYDTPIIYITDFHQQKMVNELESGAPGLIIYGPKVGYYDVTVKSLPLVNNYIDNKYEIVETFNDWQILKKVVK